MNARVKKIFSIATLGMTLLTNTVPSWSEIQVGAEDTLHASHDDFASTKENKAVKRAIKTLRQATVHYRDLDVALDDGFVLLHECEERPDEGPIGTVYVNPEYLTDGVIDPEKPDALIYEPRGNKPPKLVGVEFAIPYTLWTEAQPPQYLGASFQREDEFGVFALHAWVWRKNPDGLFAERNPRVSCDNR